VTLEDRIVAALVTHGGEALNYQLQNLVNADCPRVEWADLSNELLMLEIAGVVRRVALGRYQLVRRTAE
jgi:hypothetical protein